MIRVMVMAWVGLGLGIDNGLGWSKDSVRVTFVETINLVLTQP